MPIPANPKIYHIVHADRLPSILESNGLLSDAQMGTRTGSGTTIGMNKLKQRRLNELTLASHPELYVGQCVPFYFCPRSVMLYLIYRSNDSDLAYKGGQGPIIHLEADFHETVQWAEENSLRWAFTSGNAATSFFNDWNEINKLDKIRWQDIQARDWRNPSCKENKQAEFLIETSFPWSLVKRIGVQSQGIAHQVIRTLQSSAHKPGVEVLREWYY